LADELSWVRWVTALFVVAVAMALSFWALRRVQGAGHSWLPIRVTGRVRLNRSAELVLVEVNNERFLIGATPANISTIAQWSADEPGGDVSGATRSADHDTG
jgi:flagellar biogenesis protein FliO